LEAIKSTNASAALVSLQADRGLSRQRCT